MIVPDIPALDDVDNIFSQVPGMVADSLDGLDHEHGVNGVSDIAGSLLGFDSGQRECTTDDCAVERCHRRYPGQSAGLL